MTKTKPPNIGLKLAQLAGKLADGALRDDVTLDTRLDAFKALTTYFVGISKVKAKNLDDDDDGENFGSFRDRISSSTGGPGSTGTE